MICVLEGLPGSGKTSIINAIKERNKKDVIIVIPEILEDSIGNPDEFSFYVNNDVRKSNNLSKFKNSICLSDRYWYSTIIYHSASKNETDFEQFIKNYKEIFNNEQLFSDIYYIYLKISTRKSIEKADLHAIKSNWQSWDFVDRANNLYDLIFMRMETLNYNLRGKLVLDMEQIEFDEATKEIMSFMDANNGV